MFKPTVEFERKEAFDLIEKYRTKNFEFCGYITSKDWYKKGIAYKKIGEEYGTHDYHYFFYNDGKHCEHDLQKQKEFFLRAMECFKHSAEEEHDIAMTIYGLYIYHYCTEARQNEAFEWFMKASERGFAVADYLVSCCYYNGYGVEKDQEKSEEFLERFKTRWASSLRQRALAIGLNFDMALPSKSMLDAWCSGKSSIGVTDLPGYVSNTWMLDASGFDELNFGITLDTDVNEGVPDDTYFMEYYYM